MGWSEKNMCINCDEGGNLLVCSASGCPVAVHEECMGCPARFNGAGHFFCPYCLYKQVLAESYQSWENAMAKKKALSVFLSKEMVGSEKHVEENERDEEENVNQLEGGVEVKIDNPDHGKSRQGNDVHPDRSGRTDEDVIPHECIPNATQSKGGDVSTPAKKKDKSKSGANSSNCDKRENQEKQDYGQRLDKIVDNRQEDGKKDLPLTQDPSRRKRDGIKVHEEHKISSAEKEKEKENENEKAKEKEKKKEKLKEREKENEKEEEKEEEKENSEAVSPRNKRKERRKRLLWTKEEEDMLMEGRKKFSPMGKKNVPWRKILEFGRPVFEASRTPGDLKDKWRNNLAK